MRDDEPRSYLILDRSYLAIDDQTIRMQGEINWLRMAVSVLCLFVAIWFLSEKSRMERYFDRHMKKREEKESVEDGS